MQLSVETFPMAHYVGKTYVAVKRWQDPPHESGYTRRYSDRCPHHHRTREAAVKCGTKRWPGVPWINDVVSSL